MAFHRHQTINVLEVKEGEHNVQHGYKNIVVITPQGRTECRIYSPEKPKRGAIWVGGIGGDWDSPAKNLYPHMCEVLLNEGVISLRVKFQKPGDMYQSTYNVSAAIAYLEEHGITNIALAGHSFGGAVVIQSGVYNPLVDKIITLSTQSYGTDLVSRLSPRCALLVIHGQADSILPYHCSQQVYHVAGEPKRLVLISGADHSLDSASEQIYREIREWILSR